MKFTKDTLWELRNEIILNSLYISDYSNSFNLDEKSVSDFFDGYVEDLSDLMSERGISDNDFFDNLKEYDNAENLWEYYLGIEGEPMRQNVE